MAKNSTFKGGIFYRPMQAKTPIIGNISFTDLGATSYRPIVYLGAAEGLSVFIVLTHITPADGYTTSEVITELATKNDQMWTWQPSNNLTPGLYYISAYTEGGSYSRSLKSAIKDFFVFSSSDAAPTITIIQKQKRTVNLPERKESLNKEAMWLSPEKYETMLIYYSTTNAVKLTSRGKELYPISGNLNIDVRNYNPGTYNFSIPFVATGPSGRTISVSCDFTLQNYTGKPRRGK